MNYLDEQGLNTYDTLIKSYVRGVMSERSEIPSSLMAVINGIDSNVNTVDGKCDQILTAVSSGGSSSEDIADIKSAVNDIYAEVTSSMSHITISVVDYNDNDYTNSSQISVIDISRGKEISANQSGEYLIPKGGEYKITAVYNGSHIPYLISTVSFDGVAVTGTFHVTLVFDRIPECVDLGNGVKWATGNLTKDANGVYSIADQIEYGAYFSWGNINGRRVAGQTDSYSFDSTTYSSTTGNNLTADFTSGSAAYDAARVRLGSPWRIPTYGEFTWLRDNCTWNWKASGNTDYNGVGGYEVVGTNSNKIFLPCAGCYSGGTSLNGAGFYGYYWSTRYKSSDYAYGLYSDSSSKSMGDYRRYFGFSVRPVQ